MMYRESDEMDTAGADGSGLKTGELVARHLRREIARGDLVPGDRLPPEDELMAGYGLARTTVREGLRILESQGLIQIRRGRSGGGRVTVPGIERMAQGFALHLQLQRVTFGDLDDARLMIEPALAGRLARTRHDDDVALLQSIADAAAKAARAEDPDAFADAASQFHATIVELAGNVTMATVAGMISQLVNSYYRSASKQEGVRPYFDRAVRSYRKLVRLIDAGDGPGAEDHWRRQLRATSKGYAARDTIVQFV